jgi:hypothetical protein
MTLATYFLRTSATYELRRILIPRTPVNKMLHHLDKAFRNGARENITWVHIPVFFLASKTIITFCKAVVRAAALATPTAP